MTVKAFITIPVLALCILLLQVSVDNKKTHEKEVERPFAAPSPKVVKAASMGFHTLVADAYWLAAIQYTSECIERGDTPKELYPMADFITDLDPQFEIAYYYAGLNLALEGGDPEKVISILEKGKRNAPDNWKIPFMLGFSYYFLKGDPERAAENMERACKIKQHWSYCLLASRLRNEGGSPETSIHLLRQMMEQEKKPLTREKYQRRIDMLRAEIMERDLTELARKYQRQKGEWPEKIEDLVADGMIHAVPRHPVRGRKFVYDPGKKRIRSEPPIEMGVYQRNQEKRKEKDDAGKK